MVGAERMASVICVGKSPDQMTPNEMAVVDETDLVSSSARRDSATRLVNGVSRQSERYSRQTLSKRTLSVETSRMLRALGGLAVNVGSLGRIRTGGRPPAPMPSEASAHTAPAPNIDRSAWR